tara:strand:- start:275 stop:1357 length:1083 start_codon:yes stop_codon:yes gene_type:complete
MAWAFLHSGPVGALPLDDIVLPPGFRIAMYAEGVTNARQMALGDHGTVFVGSRSAGRVYAVVDADGDHVAEDIQVIASGLNLPSGVAFHEGNLYVGEVDQITQYPQAELRLGTPLPTRVVVGGLPDNRHHGWKYLGFGPDGKLYIPVGAPCNVCSVTDPFGTILRLDLTGGGPEVVARGVRNSVGFDWDPATGKLWFTDNGRDNLGDDLPPDELNRVDSDGDHFGFPFCHAGDIPDPAFGDEGSCAAAVPPAQRLGPHVAAIGMAFYTGTMFPERYRGAILIAEHGSWNRSRKIGYRVSLVTLSGDGAPSSYDVFAEGWLQGQNAWGRPADILVMPDGAILVSDDAADAIYRISYEGGDE